ncbi:MULTISPECIES: ROK family protein [Yersiniaceae]|uniref:ROK family protein n=1 Tax=Yersiniaceae TaxID=1903411 RepID=UPI0009349DEA|nr:MULTISPECIES: ROK family protein [Yersiniaceae]MDV5139761.1 ROK family protein [Chimaeribacter arupi]PLR33538.1 ROK family protein [Chimaeribacter arupi]
MKIAAFDIGGTSLKMGVVSSQGDILHKDKKEIPHRSGEAILAAILGWLKQHPGCEGIAISVPGYINPHSGFITMGGAIRDFDHFDITGWLGNKTGLPVSAENDANCALLAERWLGSAGQMDNVLMMTIGTGIGGAIFCNGALVSGHRFRAGEFGYILSERPGSDRLMKSTMNETCTLTVLRRRYAGHVGKNPEEVTGEEIFGLYDQGDITCQRLVNQFMQDICSGIHNLAHIFDPECIFLGGGITERPQFLEEIKQHLAWYRLSVDVRSARHGNSAGLLGAVRHYLDRHT